jgi:aspartyl-tRNA(Asn)/glutamyl-tRNA(Gln) amidotransferase subunit C
MVHPGILLRMNIHDVTRLARLALTAEEEKRLGAQLDQILEFVEQLKAIDVSGVEPMAHATPRVNVFRPDEVNASLPLEEVLRNAPARSGDLFQVPKIVE